MTNPREALRSLRREMELRWTGQFVENAVCTIDAATARIQALETSLAEAGEQLRTNAETLVQVPAAIAEARRQALEEAAKVADAKWDHWRNEHAKTGEADALFIAETCESIGIAIRALASDPLLDRQGE